MELEKLEALSCLKIKDEHREKLTQSIQGVLTMMHQIDNLQLSEKFMDNSHPEKSSVQNLNKDAMIVSRHEHIDGLHLEQGYFLAPKVIEK
jgi:aspartyl/glutamyl-tRNA(Asn/Gln) amidotransferase C subunit